MVSSGIPRRRAIGGLTRIIGARATPVVFERVSTTTGSLDETVETTTEHTEQVWVYSPRESVAQEITGGSLDGGLGGLAVSDGTVDISHNDRLTHGGVKYEVDTVVGHPNDGDADGTPAEGTDFWVITFERRDA